MARRRARKSSLPRRRAPRPRANPGDVFLNIPFDKKREYLYLSLIAALVGVGLAPRCVVEVPVDSSRLERLFDLIRSCGYSIHDLSAVEVTARPHRVPRFNMPFELGLAVALKLDGDHTFRLLESVPHRLGQSLSDLNNYDPYIHHGSPEGVFDAVRNMFAERKDAPVTTRRNFATVYEALKRFRRTSAGRGDAFTPVLFGALVVTARGAVETLGSR